MVIRVFCTICFLLFATAGIAQKPTIFIGGSAGVSSGWWLYTLGTGAGIDRTDNVPVLTFEAEGLVEFSRFGLGLGVGYGLLFDNVMEEFEDTPAQRRKYAIADKYLEAVQYNLLLEYSLFSNDKYILAPQVKFGGFDLKTTHPEKDNFGDQYFFELSALNQFRISQKCHFTLRPFYQSKVITVKEAKIPGEQHRIFSLGLSFGVRYQI